MKQITLLALMLVMSVGAFAQSETSDKWVITPVPNMKGVLGKLDINFPAEIERNILIYQPADKFLRSVSRNDKTYTIAPGEYRFTLTNVPVENVPIKRGHETRLKAGFLDIVSEGDWHLYNESKEKAYTSGNKPKKLPLPVGSYQIKLGGQFYPVIIKDGETVEDYTPIQVKVETQDQKKLPIIDTAQWQRDVRLTKNSAVSNITPTNGRGVATSGLFVHVVWQDTRDGIYEIFYKRSTDGGASWGADTRLTQLADHATASTMPSVAVSGSVVHVVWNEYDYQYGNYELYYKRSTDAGSSWGTDTRLTKETYKRISNDTSKTKFPSVAVSGNDVHVVWRDDREGHYEIYYKQSTNGGITWETDKRLTHHAAYTYCGYPSVAVSGNIVHVVWRDDLDGNLEIYYKRSVDRGSSWGTVTRLTNNSFSSVIPSVSVSGSNVHVVWYDSRDEISENGNNEIYYKRSTDGGISWGADIRLTDNSFRSEIPSVAVSGSNVHVVWCDSRAGNHEIFYKHSPDGGISWGPDAQLTNSDANYFCGDPSVAVSGKVVHVVWTDKRDGNYEIYYKRNTTGKADSSTVSADSKWVITPVATMKGVLGRLDINFPPNVERNILIYQPADKFLRSVSRNDKTYTIAPGEYRFTLTNVPVDNVPIQKGYETRLKAGYLNIVSEGDWHLYNESKDKAHTSGNKPKKLPLPVGRYQLKLGGQYYPVAIKDGEMVEY